MLAVLEIKPSSHAKLQPGSVPANRYPTAVPSSCLLRLISGGRQPSCSKTGAWPAGCSASPRSPLCLHALLQRFLTVQHLASKPLPPSLGAAWQCHPPFIPLSAPCCSDISTWYFPMKAGGVGCTVLQLQPSQGAQKAPCSAAWCRAHHLQGLFQPRTEAKGLLGHR